MAIEVQVQIYFFPEANPCNVLMCMQLNSSQALIISKFILRKIEDLSTRLISVLLQ